MRNWIVFLFLCAVYALGWYGLLRGWWAEQTLQDVVNEAHEDALADEELASRRLLKGGYH